MPGPRLLHPRASSHTDAFKPSISKSTRAAHVVQNLPVALYDTTDLKQNLCTDSVADIQPRCQQISECAPMNMTIGQSLLHRIQRFNSLSSSSSGSEHEPDSVCLTAMVTEFIENDTQATASVKTKYRYEDRLEYDDCSDSDGNATEGELLKVLRSLVQSSTAQERELAREVVSSVEAAGTVPDMLCNTELVNCAGDCLRRSVMTQLRGKGLNAAICKSRWEHTKNSPGGEYEYIDIVKGQERIIVDLDFRGQFKIARPTQLFSLALASIPPVYVGKPEKIQQIVNVMTEATKQSLKKRSMHLPPWRKPEYMRAKWLAPYKRTTNEVPHSSQMTGCVVHSPPKAGASSMVNSTLKNNISSPITLDMELLGNVDGVIFNGQIHPVDASQQLSRDKVSSKREELSRNWRQPSHNTSQIPVKEIRQRVDNMEWQPPAVTPRLAKKQHSNTLGLAAALRQSGLVQQARTAVRS